jgi:hypothetical protein
MFNDYKYMSLPTLLLASDVRALTGRQPRDGTGGLRLVIPGVWAREDIRESVLCPAYGPGDSSWLRIRERVAALQLLFPDALAGGTSAAYLLGFPLPCPPVDLEVTRPAGASIIRRRGVVTLRSQRHRAQGELTAGVAVQSLAYLVLELAGRLDEEALVYILDALLGPWNGPRACSKEELADFVAQTVGFRGRRRLLRALKRAHEGVGSPRETRLRLDIVAAGLPEPLVDHAVDVPGLGVIHPGMSYPGIKVAIEYEGGHHFWDDEQFEYDIRRYLALQKAGWLVIRVSKHSGLDWALNEVKQAIAERVQELY